MTSRWDPAAATRPTGSSRWPARCRWCATSSSTRGFRPGASAWRLSESITRVFPTIRPGIAAPTGASKSASCAMNEEEELSLLEPLADAEQKHEMTHLWVVSYSDFMTILMIFFLMLFAHRLWAKKVAWETKHAAQLRAARESQKGMVERLARLADVDVQAQRVDIHLPDALLYDAGKAELRPSARALLAGLSPEMAAFGGEIVVEGHTDDRPLGAHARYRSNWELSVARAFSVIQCLSQNGV